MQTIDLASVDAVQIRRAGKDLLSLALMDSRNQTLRWASAFEAAPGEAACEVPGPPELPPALWLFGHIGWFQEYWIARNLQRQRGERSDATCPRLASILPEADLLFDPADPWRARAAAQPLPGLQAIRQYLVDSLEITLDLLALTPDDADDESDDALYFYRLALLREDTCIERFAEASQALGFDSGLLPPLAGHALRAPLLYPTTRWQLGSAPGGFVFDNEKWAHEVTLPEFEIDAQAVSWAQYGEFVADGGYDDPRHWHADGWAWVQAQGRRTPRYVDQMRHGVLQQRFGRLVRVPSSQPVMHVNWFEADAWCHWAGRRLPDEAEWEAAAVQGATRGFRWGEVREWAAGTLRPYPGFSGFPASSASSASSAFSAFSGPPGFGAASPGQSPEAAPGAQRVQRGASFATPGRVRGAKVRHAQEPTRDAGFCGFRSCAI